MALINFIMTLNALAQQQLGEITFDREDITWGDSDITFEE